MIRQLRGLLESRFRLGVQLYMGIGGAVLLTIAASLVGWFSFNRVGLVQSVVNEGSIPEMATAFGVAQQSGNLVAAAPRLTVASAEDFETISQQVALERRAFEDQLDVLMQQAGGDEDVHVLVRENAAALVANIETIERDVEVLFELREQSNHLQTELVALQFELELILAEAIDSQLFFTLTGLRALGQQSVPRAQHTSDEEIGRYRYLSELHSNTTLATQLLANAFNVTEEPLLEPLRERFEAAERRINLSLAALGQDPWRDEIAPSFDRLFGLGESNSDGQSVFDVVAQEISLLNDQQELIQLNRDIGVELVSGVEGLVGGARGRAQEAAQTSTRAIQTGRSLLLVVNVLSIVGALMIAWLFVGRILLQRLKSLSDRMREMAEGDLEASVQVSGRDEIAEMAAALEVFRRHALEVQRLNLVEALADELSDKNDQLEVVLVDLQKAQDQIVMSEKLAALGELTAGVAHEIRNPLNFVKNFAEASEELLEELQEETELIVEAEELNLSDAQKALVQELNDDLTDNLKRIQSHSARANGIVEGMLRMGRGSGEVQSTDINNLLDEHTRLAYHSARGQDQEFILDIKMELDSRATPIEVVPQDLGRVFLNMVSNACHATNEKRNKVDNGDMSPSPIEEYMPTLWLKTQVEEELLIITIRDNGSGIPDEITDKIFNPFFTTKPTDQGTGLGLSLSNDIVREHGGTIKVTSKLGQFTEMTIELPLTRSPQMANAS